jgi:Flp pilus assembly protein TadG
MHHHRRSDRSSYDLMRRPGENNATFHRQDRESGQATTEFALILLPLLLLVAGIIQFGIGLNFWLDMQRLANQGARWAAVNCGQTANPPSTPNPCTTDGASLSATLKQQALTNGLTNSLCIKLTYPAKTPTYPGNKAGDPVRVALTAPFEFVPILGIGTITLSTDATMRLEVDPNQSWLGEKLTCP